MSISTAAPECDARAGAIVLTADCEPSNEAKTGTHRQPELVRLLLTMNSEADSLSGVELSFRYAGAAAAGAPRSPIDAGNCS
jgi:hypothetical protein